MARFGPFIPLLQAVIVVILGGWIGYQYTGRITNAIQQRQLELSHVKEMRDLVLRLQSQHTTRDSAQADALALAAFRDYAIIPLVLLLQNPDEYRWPAAENGLRAVALSDSSLVAREMIHIVSNRSRLYSWKAHLSAIRILGDIDCRAAIPVLESYERRVGHANIDSALAGLKARVASQPEPVEDDWVTLHRELTGTIEALERPD